MSRKESRNLICPVCGLKLKKCSGHSIFRSRPTQVVGGILILAMMLALAVSSLQESVVSSTQSTYLSMQHSGSDNIASLPIESGRSAHELTPMSEERAEQVFMGSLAILMKHNAVKYPVISLREKFAEIMSNLGAGRGVEYHPCGEVRQNSLAYTICEDSSCSKPLMVLVMPAWMDKIAAYSEENSEYLDDLIMLAVSHEYFHCHNQKYWQRGGDLTRDELVDSEAECWAYTIEEFILPMWEAGRGPKQGSPYYTTARVYLDNNFTSTSPGWKSYISSQVVNDP